MGQVLADENAQKVEEAAQGTWLDGQAGGISILFPNTSIGIYHFSSAQGSAAAHGALRATTHTT